MAGRILCRWLLPGLVVLLCCTGPATSAAQGPPQILDLGYRPVPFHAGSGIEVLPRLLHGEGEDVAFHCRWFVNGQVVEDLTETLLPGEFYQRGDRVMVEVVPDRQGQQGKPVRSGEVEAANAPPRIVSRPPEGFSPGQFRYAAKADDADGDYLNFILLEGPSGMELDRESGLMTWKIESWQKMLVTVKFAVEDPLGARAVQQFSMDLGYKKDKGQADE